MKQITSTKGYKGTEFFVLNITGEPTKLSFPHQFDDLMISTPDGDVLISWDEEEFDENQSLLVKPFDNLKEFNNLKSTHLLLRAKDVSATLKIYITVQRN